MTKSGVRKREERLSISAACDKPSKNGHARHYFEDSMIALANKRSIAMESFKSFSYCSDWIDDLSRSILNRLKSSPCLMDSNMR